MVVILARSVFMNPTLSAMSSLSIDNVRKVYPGGTVAVREYSLDITDGEFLVLVGPSGCGKSTLPDRGPGGHHRRHDLDR